MTIEQVLEECRPLVKGRLLDLDGPHGDSSILDRIAAALEELTRLRAELAAARADHEKERQEADYWWAIANVMEGQRDAARADVAILRTALVEVLPLAKAHLMRRFGKDTLPVAVREALAALDAPAGDTGGEEDTP